jgi:hypothetical protein
MPGVSSRISREEELCRLSNQAKTMKDDLEQIDARILELESKAENTE